MSEWTEGVRSDGAAILRDGQPVPISELLEHLNRCESIRSAALEDAAKVADDRARLLSEWMNNAMANERSLKSWPEQCATATDIATAIRALKDKQI